MIIICEGSYFCNAICCYHQKPHIYSTASCCKNRGSCGLISDDLDDADAYVCCVQIDHEQILQDKEEDGWGGSVSEMFKRTWYANKKDKSMKQVMDEFMVYFK